jgi:regulator of RNase E activity RraA
MSTPPTPRHASPAGRLSDGELLKLRRWNTPTICNGWEQVSRHDRRTRTNTESVTDYMPHMGPMVGYAVTVVCEPSNPEHPRTAPAAWQDYRRYVAEVPGPKILVVQDLDKPRFCAGFLGEVNAAFHRAVGCVGAIVDGAVRDVDDMASVGWKTLASALRVGHGFGWPVRFGVEVEAFGCRVRPGELIHADKHGFLVIPPEDEAAVLEAAVFMDGNECDTLIAAGRASVGRSPREIADALDRGALAFTRAAAERFGRQGEW